MSDSWDGEDGITHSIGDGCDPPHSFPAQLEAARRDFWRLVYRWALLNHSETHPPNLLAALERVEAAGRQPLVDALREATNHMEAYGRGVELPRFWDAIPRYRALTGRDSAATCADAEARLPVELRGDGPCGDCGTLDNIMWFTENVLWNRVTGEDVVREMPHGAILCIVCFVKRAHEVGLRPTGWRLMAEWPWRDA